MYSRNAVIDALKWTYRLPEETPVSVFSAPVGVEIGGNHTDHQHGRVLCAATNLDVSCAAASNDVGVVRLHMDAEGEASIPVCDVTPHEEEKGTIAGVIRDIIAEFSAMGHGIKGLNIYASSDVPLSSELPALAAFEVMIGSVLNHFFADDKLDAITLAKIGHRAEIKYFGKTGGRIYQMASAIGGLLSIDCKDEEAPQIKKLNYDFASSGYTVCMIDTGYPSVSEDYLEIEREMAEVAAHFKKKYLREVSEAKFRVSVPYYRAECGDRAILRAMHFFEEDRRAAEEAKALERGDFDRFLTLVNESGLSSCLHLQNSYSTDNPREQIISLALKVGRELLGDDGAIRVHGGGFGGSIQAFVPNEKAAYFKAGIEALVGAGKCRIVSVSHEGAGVRNL